MTTRPLIDRVGRRGRLVRRHRLEPAARTDDVLVIGDALVALHSSDPVTVHLSAAARMRAPALPALDVALYRDRDLVRHHAMRRTLWVLGRETARLAHHATTVDIARGQRRQLLAQLAAGGIADARTWLTGAVDEVAAVLGEAGPLSARDVGRRLPRLAVPVPVGSGTYATTQAAHTRVLLLMGFEGRALRDRPTGTWINGQYRWALAPDWLREPIGTAEAAAGLARRYLRAFGPATRADLQWWAGWTVRATARALADVGAVEVDLGEDGVGHVLPGDLEAVPAGEPSVALLPGLDPSTMGWRQRAFQLDPEHVGALFDRNGNGGPTIWVDGRIVGGWVQRPDGTIAMRLLTDVGTERAALLDEAAHGLESLLAGVRFAVRFPAPLQAALLKQ